MEERARHREACGFRGGVGAGAEARAGEVDLGQEVVLTSPTTTAQPGHGCQWGSGGEPPTTRSWEESRPGAEGQEHGP